MKFQLVLKCSFLEVFIPVILILTFFILIYPQFISDTIAQKYSWTRGADMPTPRSELSAELLDGKIYVIGGTGYFGAKDTVEVFDPAENTWNSISSLPLPLDHSGLTSYGGKLYLVGGFTVTPEGRQPSNILLIYDPYEGEWEEGPPMPTARAGLTADFVDGILYAIGGSTTDQDEGQLSINEAYNPATNVWSEKAPMPTARHHTTSAVIDGKIYIIGGRETDVPTNTGYNEMYDSKKDSWNSLAPMPTKRSAADAAVLNGDIFVFGGEKIDGTFKTNEKYDVNLNEWTEEIEMPTPRMGPAAVTFDGKIYVIGGKLTQSGDSVTKINEIFNVLN